MELFPFKLSEEKIRARGKRLNHCVKSWNEQNKNKNLLMESHFYGAYLTIRMTNAVFSGALKSGEMSNTGPKPINLGNNMGKTMAKGGMQ
jgi:hypothetical protein